jgi:glycosyltransferase involved in cell wall biosynthesis
MPDHKQTAMPTLPLPLASVVIINFNYRRYVGQAIRSVAAQSYANFECVIVDDVSTDGSVQAIEETLAALGNPRFSLLVNPANTGQMGAMKAGLARTSGKFVVFVDADDMLLPDFLTQHIRAHLNAAYSAGTSSSDTIQIDENGAMVEGTYPIFPKQRPPQNRQGAQLEEASFGNITAAGIMPPATENPAVRFISRRVDGWHGVATSGFMFRRDLVALLIPADTEPLRVCADGYLAKFAHYMAGTLAIGAPLGCYRVHGSNLWAKNPHLGGGHELGNFSLKQIAQTNKLMLAHLKANREAFQKVLGVNGTARLIIMIQRHTVLYRLANIFIR